MGRFASTVEFYARYREPYSPNFFARVAHDLHFRGTESLLDIACGPAMLALGFAPYIGQCAGLDPEPSMIEAARDSAAQAGVALTLINRRLEDFSPGKQYDILTIGRALHWLERNSALRKLEELTAPGARVLVCAATSIEAPHSLWVRSYNQLRRTYSDDPSESRYRLDPRSWFRDSQFAHRTDVSVTHTQSVSIDDLIGRALSRSNTSPDVLQHRRASFEAELRTVLHPFAHNEMLQEEIATHATIFERL